MTETRTYIAFERPTCIHVTVENARSARSAVQLARRFAARHYGMPVGHYVSSGGRSYPSGAVDYTYVFSAPDLAPYREVWEVRSVEQGRTTGATVFASEGDARRCADGRNARGDSAYVRGPVTEYRRPCDICAQCGGARESYRHAGYADGHPFVR